MAISVGKAIRTLRDDDLKSMYFLLGNDSFLQNFFIDNVKKKFELKTKSIYLNLNDESDMYLLIEQLNSISMFSSKNIFVLRNFSNIPKKNQVILDSYIKNPSLEIVLIFILEDYRINNLFSKKISERSTVVDVQTPFFENKLREWINFYLKKNDYSIDESTTKFLIQNYGDDLSNIINEVEKNYLYKQNKKINMQIDISNYNNRHIQIWHLLDSLGSKKINNSIHIFENLLLNGVSLVPIIVNLTNFYIELLTSGKKMASYNGLNNIINTRLKKYKKSYYSKEILNIILELRNLDIIIKTTSLNESLLFTPIIIKICKNLYV